MVVVVELLDVVLNEELEVDVEVDVVEGVDVVEVVDKEVLETGGVVVVVVVVVLVEFGFSEDAQF